MSDRNFAEELQEVREEFDHYWSEAKDTLAILAARQYFKILDQMKQERVE